MRFWVFIKEELQKIFEDKKTSDSSKDQSESSKEPPKNEDQQREQSQSGENKEQQEQLGEQSQSGEDQEQQDQQREQSQSGENKEQQDQPGEQTQSGEGREQHEQQREQSQSGENKEQQDQLDEQSQSGEDQEQQDKQREQSQSGEGREQHEQQREQSQSGENKEQQKQPGEQSQDGERQGQQDQSGEQSQSGESKEQQKQAGEQSQSGEGQEQQMQHSGRPQLGERQEQSGELEASESDSIDQLSNDIEQALQSDTPKEMRQATSLQSSTSIPLSNLNNQAGEEKPSDSTLITQDKKEDSIDQSQQNNELGENKGTDLKIEPSEDSKSSSPLITDELNDNEVRDDSSNDKSKHLPPSDGQTKEEQEGKKDDDNPTPKPEEDKKDGISDSKNKDKKEDGDQELQEGESQKGKREQIQELQELKGELESHREEIEKQGIGQHDKDILTGDTKGSEEHPEEQYELGDQANKFLEQLGELPSFKNRSRGPGYSIDTRGYTSVPDSVIRTLITKFLNQRFCKRDTDLNVRSNSLEEARGFYKWKIRDVIVHLETEQVTKVLNDKFGYQYANGKNEFVPLSFYFDLSGSMSNYTNLLAVIAIELLKKGVKVLVGYNERVNVQIDKIDRNITVEEFARILSTAGYATWERGSNKNQLRRNNKVSLKFIDRDIDNYLIEKKAEKCVAFSDFDAIDELSNLSQVAQVYYFCFESDFSKEDLDGFKGFIYQVENINDIESGLVKVNSNRFETLCYTLRNKRLEKKLGE